MKQLTDKQISEKAQEIYSSMNGIQVDEKVMINRVVYDLIKKDALNAANILRQNANKIEKLFK